MKIPGIRNHKIFIKDVANYSFSQFDDGSFGLWASGRAGWYELKSPSSVYSAIHRGMQEAISMFYFSADMYRDHPIGDPKDTTEIRATRVCHLFNEVG